MGGASSRGGAFSNMTEEQPLTPTPPRREVSAPRHFALSTPWTPHNGLDQLHNDNTPSDEAVSSGLEPSTASSLQEHDTNRQETTEVDNAGASSPEHTLTSSQTNTIDDDSEPYLVAFTPLNMRLKVDVKAAPSSEGPCKKKKLTNLFRTLSASAASSSARMATKSAPDRSLMVDQTQNEPIDEEMAVQVSDTSDEPRQTSGRHVFGLTRRSPYTPVTSAPRASSKYAPISDD